MAAHRVGADAEVAVNGGSGSLKPSRSHSCHIYLSRNSEDRLNRELQAYGKHCPFIREGFVLNYNLFEFVLFTYFILIFHLSTPGRRHLRSQRLPQTPQFTSTQADQCPSQRISNQIHPPCSPLFSVARHLGTRRLASIHPIENLIIPSSLPQSPQTQRQQATTFFHHSSL
jgi:hypothetical protein